MKHKHHYMHMHQKHMHDPHKPEEGRLTVEVEKRTAKVESIVYLSAALAAMAISLTLRCLKKRSASLFIGQWAAPFMIMGLYNKIVKTQGHDHKRFRK